MAESRDTHALSYTLSLWRGMQTQNQVPYWYNIEESDHSQEESYTVIESAHSGRGGLSPCQYKQMYSEAVKIYGIQAEFPIALSCVVIKKEICCSVNISRCRARL
ncbi:predicted protein [Botrytis cinerea T4]|uniref:Uncharacterized protein n=1 Tax=Botryotinia fuckeliana (strain T4) TaxID=999810 RepID=G2YAG1_BOTF4|nr:predicted protein [Botrytis cinerea T4]